MANLKVTKRTWLLILVGVTAGLLSGMFGVGGGILIVPGLVMLAGLEPRLAHGTSLAAVLPISAASLITAYISLSAMNAGETIAGEYSV